MDAVAAPGSAIGPYRVEGMLGTGGWSTVYAVTGPGGERLALKRLHDDLPPQAIARFRREVESLRRIDHPGVLRLIDAGVDGTAPYLVTPRVSGKSLREVAASCGGALGIEAAVVLIAAAADAVGAIHAAGLVHRDLKPDNIMLTATGDVVVIDLGLALGPDHSRHTAEDSVTGSVPYMAPEQIEDRTPSPTSDVWALAVVLYELATGRRPFQRDRTSEEVAAILAGKFEPLDAVEPRCPELVARLVEHCLTAAPARRPPDGGALAATLVGAIDWCVGQGVPAPAGALVGERARLAVAPRAYGATVAPLRVERCIAAARIAMAANDLFAAGRHVDRGLAIAPDDAVLRGLLDTMLGASASNGFPVTAPATVAPAAGAAVWPAPSPAAPGPAVAAVWPAPSPAAPGPVVPPGSVGDDAGATIVELPAARDRATGARARYIAIAAVALVIGAVIAAVAITATRPTTSSSTTTGPAAPAGTKGAASEPVVTPDARRGPVFNPDETPDPREITRPAHVAPSVPVPDPEPSALPAPTPSPGPAAAPSTSTSMSPLPSTSPSTGTSTTTAPSPASGATSKSRSTSGAPRSTSTSGSGEVTRPASVIPSQAAP